MFSKEKGALLKFVNAVLLLGLLISLTSLLIDIVTIVLPEGGNYAIVNMNKMTYSALSSLWMVVIYGISIVIINQKFKIFDKSLADSLKFVNFVFFYAIITSVIFLANCILKNLIVDYIYTMHMAKYAFGVALTYAISIYIVNKKNLLIKENTGGYNAIICILTLVISSFGLSVVMVIMSIFDTKYIIQDLIRNILVTLMPLFVFTTAICMLVNKNKTRIKMNFDPVTGKPLNKKVEVKNTQEKVENITTK